MKSDLCIDVSMEMQTLSSHSGELVVTITISLVFVVKRLTLIG